MQDRSVRITCDERPSSFPQLLYYSIIFHAVMYLMIIEDHLS